MSCCPAAAVQEAHVSAALQYREQQQATGRFGKIRGPGCEQRLQAPAERENDGQRLGRSALRAAEHRRKLQQRQRVPLGLCHHP